MQLMRLLLLALPALAMDVDFDPLVDGPPASPSDALKLKEDLRMSGLIQVEEFQRRKHIKPDELNAMRVVRVIIPREIEERGSCMYITGGKSRGSGLFAEYTSVKGNRYTGILTNQHVLKNELTAGGATVAFMNSQGYEVVVRCNTDTSRDGFYFTGKHREADDSETARLDSLRKTKKRKYEDTCKRSADGLDMKAIEKEWFGADQRKFDTEWAEWKDMCSHGRDWAFVGIDTTHAVQLFDGEEVRPVEAKLALRCLGVSPYNLNGRLEPGLCGFEGINERPVAPGNRMTVHHYAGVDYRSKKASNNYTRDPKTLTHPKRPEAMEEEERRYIEEQKLKAEAGDVEPASTAVSTAASDDDEPMPPPKFDKSDKPGSAGSISSNGSDDDDDIFCKAPRKVDHQTACTSIQVKCGKENTFIVSGYELTYEQKVEYQRSHGNFARRHFASTTEKPFAYDHSAGLEDRIVGDTNLNSGASGAPYFDDETKQFVAMHCNGHWTNCTVTQFGGETQHSGDLKVSGAVTSVYVLNALEAVVNLAENKKLGFVSNSSIGPGAGQAFNYRDQDYSSEDWDVVMGAALMKHKADALKAAKEAKQAEAKRNGTYVEDGTESSYWTEEDQKKFLKSYDAAEAKKQIKSKASTGGKYVSSDDLDEKLRLLQQSILQQQNHIAAEDPALKEAELIRQRRAAENEERQRARLAAVTNSLMDMKLSEEPAAKGSADRGEDPLSKGLSQADQLKAIRAARAKAREANGGAVSGQVGDASLTMPTDPFRPSTAPTGGLKVAGFGPDGNISIQGTYAKGHAGAFELGRRGLGARPGTALSFGGLGQTCGGTDKAGAKIEPTSIGQSLQGLQNPDDIETRRQRQLDRVARMSGADVQKLGDAGDATGFLDLRMQQLAEDCDRMKAIALQKERDDEMKANQKQLAQQASVAASTQQANQSSDDDEQAKKDAMRAARLARLGGPKP